MGQKRTLGDVIGMSDKGHKRTNALVFGLERNGCCGGAVTTTFAGESVPAQPKQFIKTMVTSLLLLPNDRGALRGQFGTSIRRSGDEIVHLRDLQ